MAWLKLFKKNFFHDERTQQHIYMKQSMIRSEFNNKKKCFHFTNSINSLDFAFTMTVLDIWYELLAYQQLKHCHLHRHRPEMPYVQ